MQRTLLIGERVRIHPATDYFMRGVTHGVVTSKRTEKYTGNTVYILRNDTLGIVAPKRWRMRLLREGLIAEGE